MIDQFHIFVKTTTDTKNFPAAVKPGHNILKTKTDAPVLFPPFFSKREKQDYSHIVSAMELPGLSHNTDNYNIIFMISLLGNTFIDRKQMTLMVMLLKSFSCLHNIIHIVEHAAQ